MSESVVRSAQFSVGTAAVLVGVGNTGGSRILLHQDGAGNHQIYFGGSAVTTSTGFLIRKGAEVDVYLPEGVRLYAVASSAETLYVLQTGGR